MTRVRLCVSFALLASGCCTIDMNSLRTRVQTHAWGVESGDYVKAPKRPPDPKRAETAAQLVYVQLVTSASKYDLHYGVTPGARGPDPLDRDSVDRTSWLMEALAGTTDAPTKYWDGVDLAAMSLNEHELQPFIAAVRRKLLTIFHD